MQLASCLLNISLILTVHLANVQSINAISTFQNLKIFFDCTSKTSDSGANALPSNFKSISPSLKKKTDSSQTRPIKSICQIIITDLPNDILVN